jgi:DNA-binding PadR family transcriptional regulator
LNQLPVYLNSKLRTITSASFLLSSAWGVSDNNRKAKYYRLTRAGQKQVQKEAREWEQTTAIMARFLAPGEESS